MYVVLSLSAGGTERLVIELAKRAAARFRVTVCCLEDKGKWAGELESVGIDVVALGRQPGFRPGLARRIALEASRRGVGILHCHHYTPFVYGALSRLLHRSCIVFTEHGRLSDAPPALKRRMVNPILARLASHIYAVSEDLRRHLVAEGFPASRLGVILNGIEPGPAPDVDAIDRARATLGVSPAERAILAVGRLDIVKDLETLLRAMALIQGRSWRLFIIGEGDEGPRLRMLANQLQIETRVTFLGYRQDARTLLPAADLLVNTSITEGISLTLLEAMAARLPVVATSVGGSPEVVLDGETGVLVPPRDSRAVAVAVERLLESAEWRRDLGYAARQRVERVFSLDRMAERYTDVYEELASKLLTYN